MAESELEESVPWLVEQQQQLKNQQPVPQNGGLADMAAVLLFCLCAPPCHHYATTIDDGRDFGVPFSLSFLSMTVGMQRGGVSPSASFGRDFLFPPPPKKKK